MEESIQISGWWAVLALAVIARGVAALIRDAVGALFHVALCAYAREWFWGKQEAIDAASARLADLLEEDQ